MRNLTLTVVLCLLGGFNASVALLALRHDTGIWLYMNFGINIACLLFNLTGVIFMRIKGGE